VSIYTWIYFFIVLDRELVIEPLESRVCTSGGSRRELKSSTIRVPVGSSGSRFVCRSSSTDGCHSLSVPVRESS